MKHPRLVALALAVLAATACCALIAFAGGASRGAHTAGATDCCGAKSTTTAAAASAACPATMNCPTGSAQCTAAQRAACEKMEKTRKLGKTTGAAASATCPMHGTSATAASATGATRGGAAAGTCAMHGATTAAASGTCAMHGTSTAAMPGCTSMNGKATMAAGGCTMHGAAGKGDMAAAMHPDCAVCGDEAACDEDVRALNAHAQVVALRNGAMIVYTADTPETVHALQAALARHNEQVMNALATDSDASLCGGCKSFRGAMASGKFSRELVNVKTGAQVLLTSNDRLIVQRIHDLAVAQAARTKS